MRFRKNGIASWSDRAYLISEERSHQAVLTYFGGAGRGHAEWNLVDILGPGIFLLKETWMQRSCAIPMVYSNVDSH
jgi:hypothetical protein